ANPSDAIRAELGKPQGAIGSRGDSFRIAVCSGKRILGEQPAGRDSPNLGRSSLGEPKGPIRSGRDPRRQGSAGQAAKLGNPGCQETPVLEPFQLQTPDKPLPSTSRRREPLPPTTKPGTHESLLLEDARVAKTRQDSNRTIPDTSSPPLRSRPREHAPRSS